MAAVDKSKLKPLSRFLYALGIANIGEKAAYTLAQKYMTIEKLMEAKADDFEEIHEIGNVMAESLKNFFNQPSTKKLIGKFKKAGLNMKEPRGEVKNDKFAGKKFVFTGELAGISRSLARELIKKMGGDVVSSVSKNTDFVVAGENPGSKYNQALQWGVKVLNQQEFQAMMKG